MEKSSKLLSIWGKRGKSFMSNCEPGSNKASDSGWNLKTWTNMIKLNFREEIILNNKVSQE